ncbi:unnamed protein product, partial [Rotaria magnacalcarata]
MWNAVEDMHAARCEHTATLLSSGHVLVIGGYDEDLTREYLSNC